MANITTYLENKLLDHATGRLAFSKPANTYAALFVNTPTAAYTSASPNGSEVTGVGYSRNLITWAAASSGSIENITTELIWTAQGTWSSGNQITTIGIFDTPTLGNLLWFGPLSTSVVMTSGDTFKIPVGELNITIS